MRLEGASVREIEQALGVSRSSVSRWVRDIDLTPEQRAQLIVRMRLGPIVSGERKAAKAREVRRGHQEIGRRLARERDESYVAGCMLYWAEGSRARNSVELTNSDPDLVAHFVAFLGRHFDVRPSRIKLTCNLFADHEARQHEIENFWLERLGLTRSSLRASAVNRYSKYSQKKRTNKLPYGTARVTVNDTRIVQMIYGSIQELGGFDRPEWLD